MKPCQFQLENKNVFPEKKWKTEPSEIGKQKGFPREVLK